MALRKTSSGEFGLIAKYFAPLAVDPGAFGLLDDAAILPKRAGCDLIATKDAIVEGVHFLPGDPLDTVAQKLLRVNLSDLAAKGATPAGYFLMTAFSKTANDQAVAAFAKGLARDQSAYGLSLLGGDTVATPGPQTFSCTMLGWVKSGRMIRRNGARPGDDVWVTGAIGDSGAGLSFLRNGGQVRSRAARALIAAYRTPDPPMAFGQKLYKIASAALDVSDGLIQDAGHLAAQSGIGLTLTLEAVPLSAALIAETGGGAAARIAACTAGDDYQILFTAPRPKAKAVLALAARTQTRVTRIGTAGQGRGVLVLDEDGDPFAMPKGGYTHF